MVTKKEIVGYAIASVGVFSLYGIWMAFITIFMTDYLLLSGVAIGIIVLCARIWDAINDPMMAIIAEKTRSKWGRLRPYYLWTAIPSAIIVILSYTKFNFSPAMAIAYGATMYTLLSMAYTALGIPHFTFPAVMTENSKIRTKIISRGVQAGQIWMILIMIFGPMLIAKWSKQGVANPYQLLAVIVSVVMVICLYIGFRMLREHVPPPESTKINYKKALRVVFGNKPLLLISGTMLFVAFAQAIEGSLLAHYSKYVLGNIGLMGIIIMAGLPGMYIIMTFVPKITDKFGKRKTLIAGYSICAIMGVITYVICTFVGFSKPGTLLYVMITYKVLSSFCSGMFSILTFAMVADTIEYGEWLTGQRDDALVSAVRGFVDKIGTGLSGIVIAVVIGFSGYVANAAVQTKFTLSYFQAGVTIIPAVIYICAAIILCFYDLSEKRHDQIVEELAARKNAKIEQTAQG